MAFNKVILMGNLTEAPELKMTSSGVGMTSFRIAVARRYKAEGQQDTDFIPIVAWRSTAEFICRNFAKGDNILICGQLQQRGFVDRDGAKRTVYEVLAEEVSFAGYPRRASEGTAVGSDKSPRYEEVSADGEPPF